MTFEQFMVKVNKTIMRVTGGFKRMIRFEKTEHAPKHYHIDDIVGAIQLFVSPYNEDSAAKQLDNAYPHGGGWRPFKGFELREGNALKYPGDKPLKPWAVAKLRNETICVYEYAWVAVIQEDGSFEVCRMD